jgi:hypothetical protein
MGGSKASMAAKKRLKTSGQGRTSTGFGSVEVVEAPVDVDEYTPSEELTENNWIDLCTDSDDEDEDCDSSGERMIDASMLNEIDLTQVESDLEKPMVLKNDDLIPFVAFGDSDRNKRIKKAKVRDLAEAAVLTNNTMFNYMGPKCVRAVTSDVEDNVEFHEEFIDRSSTADTDSGPTEIECMQLAIDKMESDGFAVISKDKRVDKANEDVTKFQYLQFISIRAYLRYRISGVRKCKCSRWVAQTIFDKFGGFNYKAVCIVRWAKYYMEHNELKPFKYSKAPRTKTIITDELVKESFRQHLRALSGVQRTPLRFMTDLNTELLAAIPCAPLKVSLSTATRWFHYLGFYPVRVGKNYYVDGHEREDVVLDRMGRYLPAMEGYERNMNEWSGENMEICKPPVLAEGERVVINIVHDECIVYSNDATKIVWEENGRKELRPKSNGRSQHISGFCCSCHGFISCPAGCTFKIITPGKNADGYWCNSDLVAQFEEVAPIFESHHPGCKLVFTFDNSQNHHAKAPGGLCAKTMLKGPGGKNQLIQNELNGTIYNGRHQQLWQYKPLFKDSDVIARDDNGQMIKEMKGLRQILVERGVACGDMSAEAMRLRLAEHHDFKQQEEWLATVVHARGHEILYLPKFHCELNYIESVWAYLKSYLRRNCTFSFKNLQTDLPRVLLSIPIACFKRFERHCLRFMSGYRQNDLKGPILDYIMKQYKSHRRIPMLLACKVEEYKVEMLSKMHKKFNSGK